MKNAYAITETDKGFIVKVYDNGFFIMEDIKDGKWQPCYFTTYEEAEKALTAYNDVWKE